MSKDKMRSVKIASLVVTITGILSIFIPLLSFLFVIALVSFVFLVNSKSKEFGDWIKTIKIDFPKPLRWIGGFITPLAPGYSILNKKWDKSRKKAAVLHEKMHLEMLFKQYWIIYFLILATFVGITTVILPSILADIIRPAIFSLFFVYFEYKTNRAVEKKFNVIPDKVENLREYYFYYFVIYFFQFFILLKILELIP